MVMVITIKMQLSHGELGLVTAALSTVQVIIMEGLLVQSMGTGTDMAARTCSQKVPPFLFVIRTIWRFKRSNYRRFPKESLKDESPIQEVPRGILVA